MLRTLFGELAPRRVSPPDPQTTSPAALHDSGHGGTALRERRTSVRSGRDAATDVVVDASPAAAMRAHFAATRADLDHAGAMITLLDPSGLWAAQVIHALSDAASQPVERVALRERGTLRTLAVIERTVVPRHQSTPLKVYHADIRATGLEQEEIANALAEGSHLTAVVIGAMQPHAVMTLLRSMLAATRQPEWRCPWLVFLLPPGSSGLRQRILDQDWPASVRVAAMAESLTSASSVWNTVLTAWEASSAGPVSPGTGTESSGNTDMAPLLQQDAVDRALGLVSRTEGLLACGLVNLACGDLIASDSRTGSQATLASMAAAMCAAHQAHVATAGPDSPPPDELLVTAGGNQVLLRTLPAAGALVGMVAILDRQQANLALLRFRMLEAEKHLA